MDDDVYACGTRSNERVRVYVIIFKKENKEVYKEIIKEDDYVRVGSGSYVKHLRCLTAIKKRLGNGYSVSMESERIKLKA